MTLTFLGTRGEIDIHTPRHRRHSSLLVVYRRSRVMVDCGLDWLDAVWRIRPRPHAIVLTHAHPDHAWGLRNGAPCPVYAPRQTWNGLTRFRIEDKRLLRLRRPYEVDGIIFEAFPVEHSILAPAVGYRITAGHARIFYVPDVVYIRDRSAALKAVSLFIGDGASIHRPLVRRRGHKLIGHAPVSAQLTWCRKARISRAIITHCGSGIVSVHARAAAVVRTLGEQRGVDARIAFDGMEVVI